MGLQLRIELATDGFLLGDRRELAAIDILELILQRRRNFEEFDPQSFWEVKFDPQNVTRLEVCRFGQLSAPHPMRPQVSDGVWAYSRCHN